MAQPDRFVVGTGRCGSTLLSRMLGCHPDVLSISEFFTGLDRTRSFDPAPISGRDLAELLSKRQPVLNEVLERGHDVVEVTYDFDDPARRFTRGDVPWLAAAMLPRLTAEPDSVFDALLEHAARLPARPLGGQYRAVFAWLTARFGKEVWVERSGSSIEYVGQLFALFPEARFVHLHRDGREAALSMRAHAAYRLAVSLLYADRIPGADTAPGGIVGEEADFITGVLKSEPPAELFGRYWSDQLSRGFAQLARIDPDRYMEVRFEDLLAEPVTTLAAIGDFLELGGDETWLSEARALLSDGPPSRFPALDQASRAALDDACSVGMRLLGR